MDDVAVVNASPLIFFSRSGHWGLLTNVAKRVLVPDAVAAEIMARGAHDPTVKRLQEDRRIETTAAGPMPLAIGMWGLGPGESSVIALARAIPGAVAVIDDLAGRKCAVTFGLQVRGTLGIVLPAKQRRLIPSARVVLDDMLKSGMYLSRTVLDNALARVGE
jgi:predicted nucleic acid-binding protein